MDDAPDFDDLMEEAMQMQEPTPEGDDAYDYEMMLAMQEEDEEQNAPPKDKGATTTVVNSLRTAAQTVQGTGDMPLEADDVSMSSHHDAAEESDMQDNSPPRQRPIKDAFSFERYVTPC